MHTVRLESANHTMFSRAMALYQISFPMQEQREMASQQAVLNREAYHFDLLYEGDSFVGLLLYWEEAGFVYVEHFCIEPGDRGKGYGGQALELLRQKGKPLLLEIDPPVDETARKRKRFYERAGFVSCPFRHIHPPYREGHKGHVLEVLSYPGVLDESGFLAFQKYLVHTVMGEEPGVTGAKASW